MEIPTAAYTQFWLFLAFGMAVMSLGIVGARDDGGKKLDWYLKMQRGIVPELVP
jgi:hypothetical protein